MHHSSSLVLARLQHGSLRHDSCPFFIALPFPRHLHELKHDKVSVGCVLLDMRQDFEALFETECLLFL